jgi:hypothetical protein
MLQIMLLKKIDWVEVRLQKSLIKWEGCCGVDREMPEASTPRR